ncbi:hypothetical protein niasHT_003020 [Heterodera trifolii]|uniref:Uncharacterized protein n=1 Tax=Heterodera trifolii TaxID=157864 RepID=A0ABD2M7W3_9BILA
MKNGQNILKRMKQKEEKNEHDGKKQLQEFKEFAKKFRMEFLEISKNSTTVNELMDKELLKPSDLFEFVLNKLELAHFANETKLGHLTGANGGAAKQLSADAKKVSHRRQKRRGRDPIPFPLLIIAFFVFAYYTYFQISPILFFFVFFLLVYCRTPMILFFKNP